MPKTISLEVKENVKDLKSHLRKAPSNLEPGRIQAFLLSQKR